LSAFRRVTPFIIQLILEPSAAVQNPRLIQPTVSITRGTTAINSLCFSVRVFRAKNTVSPYLNRAVSTGFSQAFQRKLLTTPFAS
jgi:hypothetical protein